MRRVRQGAAMTIAAFAVVALAACDGSRSPVAPERTTADPGGGAATAGASSAGVTGGSPEVNAALARVRAATAKYHDVDAAIADGYVLDPVCVSTDAGAMGIHAVNEALIRQPGVVAEKPEVLLYEPKKGGGFRLVGVEYLEVVIVQPPGGVPGPWVNATQQWPSTYTVLNSKPTLFGHSFDGYMAGHSPTMPWHWDFHVWIWQPNPSGMFAQFNPSVSCTP